MTKPLNHPIEYMRLITAQLADERAARRPVMTAEEAREEVTREISRMQREAWERVFGRKAS